MLVPMPAVRLPVLRYAYKSKEGKDLEKFLEKELKGNHERVILNVSPEMESRCRRPQPC